MSRDPQLELPPTHARVQDVEPVSRMLMLSRGWTVRGIGLGVRGDVRAIALDGHGLGAELVDLDVLVDADADFDGACSPECEAVLLSDSSS